MCAVLYIVLILVLESLRKGIPKGIGQEGIETHSPKFTNIYVEIIQRHKRHTM